jgi:hypothetical protein
MNNAAIPLNDDANIRWCISGRRIYVKNFSFKFTLSEE